MRFIALTKRNDKKDMLQLITTTLSQSKTTGLAQTQKTLHGLTYG